MTHHVQCDNIDHNGNAWNNITQANNFQISTSSWKIENLWKISSKIISAFSIIPYMGYGIVLCPQNSCKGKIQSTHIKAINWPKSSI